MVAAIHLKPAITSRRWRSISRSCNGTRVSSSARWLLDHALHGGRRGARRTRERMDEFGIQQLIEADDFRPRDIELMLDRLIGRRASIVGVRPERRREGAET